LLSVFYVFLILPSKIYNKKHAHAQNRSITMATTNPTTTAASTDTPNTATDNTTDNDANTTVCSGSIIVVAKCPVAGQSKTRLIPLLGVAGSAQLAKAMLADVLTALGRCVSMEYGSSGRVQLQFLSFVCGYFIDYDGYR
jgi:hypothetical protein